MKKHKSCTPDQASTSNGTAEVFVLPPELLAKLGINLSKTQHSKEISPTTSIVKDTVQNVDHSIPKYLPENEDSSSIIQTANLMKESVFLSPTFFQTAPTVAPEDEPIGIDKSIVNTNTSISTECGTLSHNCNRSSVRDTEVNSIVEQSAPQLPNDSVVIKPNTGITVEEVNKSDDYESIKEYQVENCDGNLILKDVPYQNTGNNKLTINKSDSVITVDEPPDEAYLSDCSNSYSGCSPESLSSDVNKKKNASYQNESYEISKEYATNLLQHKNIEDMDVICSTSDTIFTSVNMNSLVTVHESYSDIAIIDKQPAIIATIQSINDEPASNSETIQSIHSENNISLMPDQNKEIEVTKNNFSNKKASVIDSSLNEYKKSDISSIFLVNSEKQSQENVDLVLIADKHDPKELSQGNAKLEVKQDLKEPSQTNATGLVPIAEVHLEDIQTNNDKQSLKKNENNPNSNKTAEIKTKEKENIKCATESINNTQDRVKEIAAYLSQIANERKNIKINNNKNIEKEAKGDPNTSKLCIQGVEKPGGKLIQNDKLECASVSKTYQRAIIQKQIPRQIKMPDAGTTLDLFQITDNNHDTPLDGTKVRALIHQNEFCICHDFGNLAYYDCEMLYEHIHFWSHKNIEYDIETFYSIYYEDYTLCKQIVDLIEDAHQHEHDGTTVLENKLCWNEMYTPKSDEETCELSITKSRPSMEAGSSNQQKSKNDAIREKSSVEIDQDKKLEVKNIKSGICNQIESEKESEVHKETVHNSLASGAERKLKNNSGTPLEPSKFAESTQNPTRKSQTLELESPNTATMIKSNSTSVPEASPKSSEKSVDVAVGKSSKRTISTSKLENVVSSTSPQTETSKIHSNEMKAECIKSRRPTDKSSFNSDTKTADLPKTSNKTDRPKRKSTVSADVFMNNDTNNENSKTTRMHSKGKNDPSESIGKSTENSNLTKSTTMKEIDNPTHELSAKGNTLKEAKAIDVKPARKTSDINKSTNNMHQETNTGTTKSTKRSLNSEMDYHPVKKIKTTESSTIIEVVDDVSKKHPKEKKAARLKRIKDEKQSSSASPSGLPEPIVVPSKIKKDRQNRTVEITIMNSTFPNESMDMTIEDSTINHDRMNMTIEESTIPDESAVTMETSTLSSDQSKEYYMVIEPVQMSDDLTKCGVCEKSVEKSQWIDHISKEHDYIAWRAGEPALELEDEIDMKKHLQGIANENGGLTCSKCGLVRKFAKAFLRHFKSCDGEKVNETSQEQIENDDSLLNSKSRKSREKPVAPPVTCGVCSVTVEQSAWIEHIQLAHKYLAWTSEEQPLDLNSEKEVKDHLKYISKHHGGLVCNSCGVKWNYAKKYLHHIGECDGKAVTKPSSQNDRQKVELVLPPIVTCGVCKLDVEGKLWIKHIQVAHQYEAWIGGEPPLDSNNSEQMKEHLDMIVRAAGELACMNCGEARKSTRAYLQHMTACAKTGFQIKMEEPVTHDIKTQYVCGVCRESGKLTEWNHHAMSMHYNIAWKVGDVPINLKNPYAVEKYLKQYKKKHGLVCLHCKGSRSSCYGFYAHILTCGRTEEEIEAFHDECEICKNKYLCIYRNQHMAAHRDSEARRERRELLAREAEQEVLHPPREPEPEPLTKRRAAEKAKKVIQKHSLNTVNGIPVCKCGATFKDAEELSQHRCAQMQTKDDDESDVSVKMENESEESAVEIIDSGVSDEDDEKNDKKKKRVRVGEGSSKVMRMPYRVNNYNAYLCQAYKDFVRLHFTTERLFNEWRDSSVQVVPDEERAKYLPQVTESCKVRFGDNSDEWTTYTRFEAKKIKGYSMFTGGATQCIAWAPPNSDDETLKNYLAVCSHRGPDVPRYGAADRPHHPAALQIWDFGNFDVLPRCALCIAHEYGVVWAMDWCPSGARDASTVLVPHEYEAPAASFRLGLLAVACSTGSAYVLAVPCPPSDYVTHEPVMYKLKPVAELRLTMAPERQIYQATSIKWSQQKGHSIIIVGYSDGSTALYDLNTESPFLTATEKGVAIYYPFQDRRSESSSITGVGICATANESYPVGGQFSTSTTGGTLCGGAAARPSARVHLAVGGALHAAHWPAVTLAGDVPFMRAVSEMEWWGGGRRVGAGRAWAACARCGRAASAAPPALRSHRHHPAYPEIKKLIVAMLLMVPLGQKKKRKVNDDLSVVVEPLTYEDAAAKYGLELTFVTKSSRSEQSQAQQICNENEYRPDRFPLSEIVALAFCPSGRFHDRIALATHTGLIFVINM